MKKRVVLQDIARAVGVSKNTVSHALRDLPDISNEMKVKIKAKAQEMGYIPNNISVLFRQNSSRLVGIVTCDLINPYYSVTIDSLIKKLNQQGLLSITILTESGFLDFEIFKALLNYQVGAIISLQDLSKETYEFLEGKDFPIVVYGLVSEYPNIPSIYTDDYEGGRLVGEEFIKQNRFTKPCFVGWQNVETCIRRKQGFIDALNEHNITPDEEIVGYQYDYKKLYEKGYDFIFAYCDVLGLDIRDTFKSIGYKEYKIYGFDGLNASLSVAKRIDSVTCDHNVMSRYAAFEVTKAIERENYRIKSKKFPVYIYKNSRKK